MRLSLPMLCALAESFIVAAVWTATSPSAKSSATAAIGYDSPPNLIPSTVHNSSLSFGQHYAVLNLDLLNAIVGAVNTTQPGQTFIHSVARWIDAVHAQSPPPLTIFTRIYFTNSRQPELAANTPFGAVARPFGNASDPKTQIYPAFHVDEAAGDIVLQKTRYYAGFGNALEEILSTQGIDTVILSGLSTSGVILSTAYRLFDLNYHVYVIANNTLETPPHGPEINDAILEGIIPRLPAQVITLDQAIAALGRSGPAVY